MREGVAETLWDNAEMRNSGVVQSTPPPSRTMTKGKSTSSDRVRCGCGCGCILSRQQQSHHLQAHGPVMAVAEVIETRAYFRKRGVENPEPPPPQKRQRLEVSEPPDGNFP